MSIINQNTEVTELGEGKFQNDIYTKPLWYKKNNIFLPITNVFKNSLDPNFDVEVDEMFNLRIKTQLTGNSPMIRIEKGKESLKITPLDTNNVVGVVNNSEVLYSEAWNNADLKITINNRIIKKDILLKKGHPETFMFFIKNKTEMDENLIGKDFYIESPYLYKKGINNKIELIWEKSYVGKDIILSVTLPKGGWEGWTLDPTYVSQPDGSSGKDSYIDANNSSANFATAIELKLSNWIETIYTSWGEFDHTNNFYSYGLVQFDLSTIPTGSTVSSASLYLRQSWQPSVVDNAQVYRLLKDWTENQVTWSISKTGTNWSSGGAEGAGTDYNSTSIGSFSFHPLGDKNISLSTSVVQTMIPGGSNTNYGFIIKPNRIGDSNNEFFMFSSDYNTDTNYRPKLTIDYTESGGSARVFGPAVQSM